VLVVNEYSVEQVLKGTYAGKTIRVAQWGMLDLKPTPLAAQEPGTSVKLVLETFIDHDELVPELKLGSRLGLTTGSPRPGLRSQHTEGLTGLRTGCLRGRTLF